MKVRECEKFVQCEVCFDKSGFNRQISGSLLKPAAATDHDHDDDGDDATSQRRGERPEDLPSSSKLPTRKCCVVRKAKSSG